VSLQVIRVDSTQGIVARPKLIDAFNEIRGYGVSMDKLIDLHEQIVPWSTRSARCWCASGARRQPDQAGRGSSPNTEVNSST
jgi:hypothetical protein